MRKIETAVRKAKALAQRRDSSPFDLAEALWCAEREGKGSIARIVEETGLGSRRARYLRKVWGRFAGQGIDRDLLEDVGWTKLALIESLTSPGVDPGWLDLAQRNTVKELDAILRGGRQDKPKAHSVLLRLSPRQYKTFASVLLQFGAKPAKKGRGLRNKEAALMKALSSMEN